MNAIDAADMRRVTCDGGGMRLLSTVVCSVWSLWEVCGLCGTKSCCTVLRCGNGLVGFACGWSLTVLVVMRQGRGSEATKAVFCLRQKGLFIMR